MEMIIYYLLCLLARKKLFINVSYFIGTIAFISLSYNTANKLIKVPVIRVPDLKSSINISEISDETFRYDERTKSLETECSNNSITSTSTLSYLIHPKNVLNHLGFVLRSHSLFYCSVPKVATRTLLTYITYLHIRDELITSLTNNSTLYFNDHSNLFRTNYLNQMLSSSINNDSLLLLSHFLTTMKSNSSHLDLWLMYQKIALPYIRLRTFPDLSMLFSTSFTRVIFVRHPFERLASAYVDKITSLKAEPFSLYDSLRRAICRKFASSYLTDSDRNAYRTNKLLEKQINEPCRMVKPTFEHFIEYIMSSSSQTDVHWQPYSTLCDVCKLKYNFIGKYETMGEDLKVLRSKLGLNSTNWNVNNYFSTGKTKENYKLMYSKLPNHLICNLKDFYDQDFKFFDYRLEDYLGNYQQISCPNQHYRRFAMRI